MTDKLFERIMAIFQMFCCTLIFVGIAITFVNHGIIHYIHWFPTLMFTLLFILGAWLFKLSIKDLKNAFKQI